jgi:hypothetical protein
MTLVLCCSPSDSGWLPVVDSGILSAASALAYPLAGLEFIIVNQYSKYMGELVLFVRRE